MTHKIDGGLPVARAPGASVTSVTPRAGAKRPDAVGATPQADSVRLTDEAAGLQALGRQLGAGSAGIDMQRVEAARAAIADGSYRVDAQTIASKMLELDKQLAGK